MRSKNLIALCAAATLLLLAACDEGAGKDQQAATPSGASATPAIEVGVLTLKPENASLLTELPGRISAFQAAEIRPQVSGIVMERLFEEGSTVKAGQQLYQIDPSTYKAEYNTAVAQMNKAQATLKFARSQEARYKELLSREVVSRQKYEDVTASLEQAQADVAIAKAAKDAAQINLNFTKVISPIAGRIGKSAVTAGALVTQNQTTPIALVQQLDPIYVDLTQSSADLMKLRQKMAEGSISGEVSEAPVELLLDDVGHKYPHTGTLKFADVTVDEATGNVQIRAVFPNPDGDLLPGLFVRAILKQGEMTDVLLVPQQSIVRSATGEAMAWVVDAENKAQMKPVETTKAVQDKWIVTSGLSSGDRVIVEGSIKLQPGAPVNPVELPKAHGNTKPLDLVPPDAETTTPDPDSEQENTPAAQQTGEQE